MERGGSSGARDYIEAYAYSVRVALIDFHAVFQPTREDIESTRFGRQSDIACGERRLFCRRERHHSRGSARIAEKYTAALRGV